VIIEQYVTLFDSLFLPQGLALHGSLEAHGGQYKLWILCVDDEAHRVLTRLELPNVRLISLADVETPELRGVRPGRTAIEYCWTLTPFSPRFVFEADARVERVTYLDADLWFRKSPNALLTEFEASSKKVLITDHGYAAECDSSDATGQYCAQFMTFARAGGECVRQWWEDRCLEWCFARSENGKYGDQKYLDDWPVRFGREVHVLQHPEWTLAPWNATRFPYGQAITYHFHGLRLIDPMRVNLGDYVLPPVVLRHVYGPYLDCLRRAVQTLRKAGFEPSSQGRPPSLVGSIKRILSGVSSQRWRFNARHTRAL
jgi:hypothetical protein